MVEKYWTECSKEERKAVNNIAREFKKKKAQFLNKEIKWWQYYLALSQLLEELDFCEWFFSDEHQEFLEYKKNYENYNEFRKELLKKDGCN